MKQSLTAIIAFTAFSGATALAGVAAKFEPRSGGTTGKGDLRGVPFIWESSKPIDKTMLADIRTKDFSGGSLTLSFESPVNIESIEMRNANRHSAGRILFYAADGSVIVPAKLLISSPEGFSGFSDRIVENAVEFNGGTNATGNFTLIIDLLPEAADVSKIVIETIQEPGLLDLRINGDAAR